MQTQNHILLQEVEITARKLRVSVEAQRWRYVYSCHKYMPWDKYGRN